MSKSSVGKTAYVPGICKIHGYPIIQTGTIVNEVVLDGEVAYVIDHGIGICKKVYLDFKEVERICVAECERLSEKLEKENHMEPREMTAEEIKVEIIKKKAVIDFLEWKKRGLTEAINRCLMSMDTLLDGRKDGNRVFADKSYSELEGYLKNAKRLRIEFNRELNNRPWEVELLEEKLKAATSRTS